MVDQGEKLQQSFTKNNNKIFAQFMVDRACQALHLSTILPTLASGAYLTILVFGIWGAVIFGTRSLGALRAPTSRLRPFGPA